MDALIIVDCQNDFCPGGALAVPDGDAVIEPINRLAREAPFVVATRDWHPPDHGSFAVRGGRWPVHCVQESEGAQLHAGIDRDRIDAIINKGQRPDAEGYSGFEGTGLERLLREHGARDVHVAGLALDYCVKATALDAVSMGFDTVVLADLVRAVDLTPGDGDRAVAEMEQRGVEVRRSGSAAG
jgi:nicotinamidase/pyrazinamidase